MHTGYDLDQSVTSVAPDGVPAVTTAYEPSTGRLSSVTFSAGTTSFGYDSDTGRVRTITAPGSGVSYGFDGSLLKSTTWSGSVAGTVSRTFDSDFRVATETAGGQTISYGYDNDSLLTAAGALTIVRNPTTGFVSSTTLGSITDSHTYNSYGEEQTYSASYGATTLYSVDYGARDAFGRIATKTETIQGATHVYGYTYDAVGRLTDVTTDGNPTSHYEYDANGNRTVAPGLTSVPVYDAQDRMTSYGACTYGYKPDGSLQTKICPDGTTSYDYDSFGNLRHVTLPSGTNIDYVIDGQNRRIGKMVNGTLVEGFLYRNQLQPAAWLDGTGAVKATFIYGLRANVPEYMLQGGSTYRFIKDQVGSVRLVVNTSTGTVAERIDYDEFGNVLSETAPGTQPFGFAGGLRDLDTGLTRFGVRDYDPATDRWAAKDPIWFRGSLTNLYSHGNGDPVNRIDLDGHNAVLVVVTVVGAVAAAYGLYKFIDSTIEAGKAVERTQALRSLQQEQIDKMLRGESIDPSIFDQADQSQQQAIRDMRDMLDHLPPGTSMTPDAARGVLRGQRLLCPKR